MPGTNIIGILILSIGFIILTSTKFQWHPFFSLLGACILVGLLSQMPLKTIAKEISHGFGSLLGSVGLVVVLGSILGSFLERSGMVNQLGENLMRLYRGRYPSLTMSALGTLLGIPVFCDSGFLVLVSLAKNISLQTNTRFPVISLSLASGLYASHNLVPPTPGPIAAAGNLGASSHLGIIILTGFVVAIPTVMLAYLYALRVGKKLESNLEISPNPNIPSTPSHPFWLPYTVILLPLFFITTSSLLALGEWQGPGLEIFHFLGHPLLALLVGIIVAALFSKTKENKKVWVQEGISQAGPIVLLTGCGGAFGSILKATSLSEVIAASIEGSHATGITFLCIAFAIAAVFKTAQGSSTSSLVITSALLSPLAPLAGFESPFSLALLVSAIGAGSMMVSHANDSYFWVVSQFSGMNLKNSYLGISGISLVQGLTAMATVILLHVVFL